MSKPLELTAYPQTMPPMPTSIRDERGWNAYYEAMDERRRQILRQQAKRLTDPELCAEYESARCDYLLMQHTGSVWTPLGETWLMNPQDAGNRVGTLHRFATAPHYYEEQE